jgi:DNA replication protein DnaC
MESIGKVIPMARAKIPTNESPEILNSSECPKCFGAGMECTERGAKLCECRVRAIQDARLARIPPSFRHASLATIKPRTDIHSKQAQAIKLVTEHPNKSYVLAGEFGTGKSMIMWALYRYAVERNETRIVSCTLTELLTEYKQAIQESAAGNDPKLPRLNAWELRREEKFSVFFDDIDKARPTEYTAEILFELVDAIYTHDHQLVATTNLSIDELIDHFNRADRRFGGSIVRRLIDDATVIEMF